MSSLSGLTSLILCCSAFFATTAVEAGKHEHEQKNFTAPREDEGTPETCTFSIPDASKPSSMDWDVTIDLPSYSSYMGFICLFASEGPTELIWEGYTHSPLQVPVQAEDGEEIILHLRGSRHNSCNWYTMNSACGCGAPQPPFTTTLRIDYSPDDNPDLPAGKLYTGAMPVQAKNFKIPGCQKDAIIMISIQK